jgi:transposase
MSIAIAITRTEHMPAELRAAAVKSDAVAKSRRLLAIAMVLEGASRQDAGRHAGMDCQTLRDWMHRYNETGIDGLA